jgi:hypothetical protein
MVLDEEWMVNRNNVGTQQQKEKSPAPRIEPVPFLELCTIDAK